MTSPFAPPPAPDWDESTDDDPPAEEFDAQAEGGAIADGDESSAKIDEIRVPIDFAKNNSLTQDKISLTGKP